VSARTVLDPGFVRNDLSLSFIDLIGSGWFIGSEPSGIPSDSGEIPGCGKPDGLSRQSAALIPQREGEQRKKSFRRIRIWKTHSLGTGAEGQGHPLVTCQFDDASEDENDPDQPDSQGRSQDVGG
jgi:hypothetical protein